MTILAIGVGVSAARFSRFRTVIVRQLPIVEPDRIVVMRTYAATRNVSGDA